MKISEDQVEHRQIAGHTKAGSPVVYVKTKGGLHAFFSKSDGEIESMGAAPHRAIAMWLAEKKSEGLKWNEDFKEGKLKKSETVRFQELRNAFFAFERPALAKSEQQYLVYDALAKSFEILTADELRRDLNEGKRHNSLIRPTDFSEPVVFGRYHKLYG